MSVARHRHGPGDAPVANRRPTSLTAVAATVVTVVALAACSSTPTKGAASGGGSGTTSPSPTVTWASPGLTTVPGFYDPPTPLPPAAAGTIIRKQVVTGIPGAPPNSTVWRILYHSRSVTGSDVAVSGYVVVPNSPAPPGGRPVVTWAHGTTGTARQCAPSLFAKGAGGAGPSFAENLASYISAGYIVAATDYEGLGGPGIHPYVVGRAEGQDVLDAARAARHLAGSAASSTVVIVGHSQGGHASLFAGQLAPSYAPDLKVVGTVAIAPLTETATALPLAEKVGETALLAMAAYAWAHTYPDLSMGDLFVPSAIPTVDHVESTMCEGPAGKKLGAIPVDKLFRMDFATNPALETHLQENSPGAVHTPSPILILQGTADTTIPDVLAQTFEQQQCPAVHDDLALRLYTGKDHTTVVPASTPDMLSWIHDRVSGTPLPAGCTAVTLP